MCVIDEGVSGLSFSAVRCVCVCVSERERECVNEDQLKVSILGSETLFMIQHFLSFFSFLFLYIY